MEYEEKFNELKKYAQMKTEEDVRLFDLTVYELAGTKDLGVLEKLIDVFDDNCEFHEVMYSLVHAIETYPAEIYVKGILSKVKDFRKYPEWFQVLIYGILNSGRCFELFRSNLHIANKDKLKELLNLIYEESEDHRTIINELRQILDNTDPVK